MDLSAILICSRKRQSILDMFPRTSLDKNWYCKNAFDSYQLNSMQVVEGVKETANPFERNKNKESIEKRLKERGLDVSEIKFNENYDDGSYSGGKIDND